MTAKTPDQREGTLMITVTADDIQRLFTAEYGNIAVLTVDRDVVEVMPHSLARDIGAEIIADAGQVETYCGGELSDDLARAFAEELTQAYNDGTLTPWSR